jgi:hypothetical protein
VTPRIAGYRESSMGVARPCGGTARAAASNNVNVELAPGAYAQQSA